MKYAIEMLNITKDFPGIKANDNVTVQVKPQSIHVLLGENGAGKSTLMSILFGLYQPTSGEIKVKGEVVKIADPNVANELGIGMVHQHFKLIETFTVTENIILGLEPKTPYFTVDIKKAAKRVKELSELYGLNVDPYSKIEDITVGMQQRVEILKMLYRNADILIFDEPTAVLTPQEITDLMQIMRNLIKEGKTILLITHKLKEIKEVGDVCTVLRKGKSVGTIDVKTTSEKEMAEMMVGRDVNFHIDKKEAEPKEVVLEVKNLFVKNKRGITTVNDFNIQVRAGEVVGLAGIDGNGQTELIYALTGLAPVVSGEIILDGKNITKDSVKKRIEKGVGHIPEDRHKHGLVLDFMLKENLVIHDFGHEPFSKNMVLNQAAMDEHANKLIEMFDIRSGQGKDTTCRSMSGGNQQKAIIAREIYRSPKLLIVVQPTRGLDVGAIEYIHNRIISERDNDKAVLLVSLELDEIIELSDKISVIHNGHNTSLIDSNLLTENDLGLLMSGAKKEDEIYEKK